MLCNLIIDKRRMLQILLNFLSNSIKFTPAQGFIKVHLNVLEVFMDHQVVANDSNQISRIVKDLKYARVEIVVEDNGVGISQENIAKLF